MKFFALNKSKQKKTTKNSTVRKKKKKTKRVFFAFFAFFLEMRSKSFEFSAKKMANKGHWREKLKEKLKSYWRRAGKHLALIGFLLAYTFAGAPLFLFLEKPAQLRRYELAINQSLERQANFTAEFEKIFQLCRNSEKSEKFENAENCENLIAQTIFQYELQLGMLKNRSAYDWDFWNAMFYAGTIVMNFW